VKWLAIVLIAGFVAAGIAMSAVTSVDKAPRMTAEQLKSMMGNPGVIILESRIDSEWKESPAKIKGAVRLNPSSAKAMMDKIPKDKTLVFYCA